jgi:hypothetical protein
MMQAAIPVVSNRVVVGSGTAAGVIAIGLPNASTKLDVPTTEKLAFPDAIALKDSIAIEKLAGCNAASWTGVSNETSPTSTTPGVANEKKGQRLEQRRVVPDVEIEAA